MKFELQAKITGIGRYVPEKIITNDDMSKIVDTSAEWIYSRTGIKERRISEENVFSSDLAIRAVKNMLENSNCDLDGVDFVIVSTVTQDYYTPSVAAIVQAHFGIPNTACVDINSACSGYVNGLQLAFSLVTSGQNKKVLLITTETLSKIIDYKDRSTCVLFGDAATATIIEKSEDKQNCFSFAGTNGNLGKELFCTNLSNHINGEKVESPGVINQNGKGLYAFVMRELVEIVKDFMDKNSLSFDSIDWFVPHSANAKMISKFAEHLAIPGDKILLSLEKYGNTSSCSIPLSLSHGIFENKIKKGDKIFTLGFGGGVTYAGLVFNY